MQIRKAERTTHLTSDNDVLYDISDTGACLLMKEKLTPGGEIKVELKSKEKSLTVDAKIIYTRPLEGTGGFKTGIHFMRLLESQADLIHDMVDDYGRGIPLYARPVK